MTTHSTITRRNTLALIAGSIALAKGNTAIAGSAPVIQQFSLGDENAPIEVIEYSSLTCPHCANFEHDVFPLLKENFIDTGKIHFIYRPVYFDGPGLWADMMARCPGDNEKFFEIISLLFQQQAQWSRHETPADVAQALVTIGLQAGLDQEHIFACLQDNEMAQALVADFQANATHHGINSTPSFVIDGVLTQNMSYPSFAALLNAKLES